MKARLRIAFPTALIALLLVPVGLGVSAALAPASAQQPATVTRTAETTAVIETVDRKTRQVLIRKEDGTLMTVVVGPEVRNFARLKPGDRVHARYEVAVAASIAKPGQPALADRDVESMTRSLPGQRPFAQRSIEAHRRVTITGIDLGQNTVSFTSPNNVLCADTGNAGISAHAQGRRHG